MNYQKHYDLLINRAKNRLLESDQYTEKHHIIPRCMGGDDSPDNLVELTAEEHYVAHQLLVKIYPDHRGLAWAAIQMTGQSMTNDRSKNKLYGWLKRKSGEQSTKRNKKRFKCPKYREETIKQLRDAYKKAWDDPIKTERMKESLSKNSKKMWDLGHGKRVGKANKEYWADPENREKASERAKGKNNPAYGTHWYHDPKTLRNVQCKPDEVPEGYVKGRKLVPDKPNTKCQACGANTGSVKAKWCDTHRPKHLKKQKWVYETMKEINDRMCLGETGKQLAEEFGYKQRTMYYHLSQYREKHV